MSAYWDQGPFDARFEWGIDGITRLGNVSDAIVIVDVLSFTTCVSVAVDRGSSVFPYLFSDESAVQFARLNGATLAVPREQVSASQPYSLSPASLQSLEAGDRIVLPSPNGATLSVEAASFAVPVLAGCLRNARAVGMAVRQFSKTITVIAAGEKWDTPSFPLRPAYEDLIGAGAILAAFEPENPSPEALAAIASFQAGAANLRGNLDNCSSGRELIERGFTEDVDLASNLDASATVPLLENGAYGAWNLVSD